MENSCPVALGVTNVTSVGQFLSDKLVSCLNSNKVCEPLVSDTFHHYILIILI